MTTSSVPASSRWVAKQCLLCLIRHKRHTVATRLLEVDTPLEVISDIMGHLSPNSTRRYTKVAIEALRTAALDIEEWNPA
jgi:integrase